MVYRLSREPAKNTTVGNITCNNGDEPLRMGRLLGSLPPVCYTRPSG